VKTYTLQDLIVFSNSDVDVKRVLRLDVLSMRETKTSADKIIDTLKKDKLRVDGRIAAAIGKIVMFLGLNHKSSKEMLSRAVSLWRSIISFKQLADLSTRSSILSKDGQS
jgi:hypothetical protein